MMKKFVLILSLMTGFAACSSTDSKSPTAVLDDLFTAMKSGNLDEMKKFITRSDVNLIETGEKLLSSADPEAVKKMKAKISEDFKEKSKTVSYTLKNEKIDGDNATVEAEVTENGKTSSHQFDLVKEEGTWKIPLTKPGNEMFNSMKGNMGPDKINIGEGLEKLKNMPPDSLKMLLNKGMQAWDSLDKAK